MRGDRRAAEIICLLQWTTIPFAMGLNVEGRLHI